MPDLGPSTNAKVEAFRTWLEAQGLPSLPELLDRYGEDCFEGTSIRKAELFKNLLIRERELTVEQDEFVNQRVGTGRLRFYRGRRTNAQYAANLAIGWMVEDIIKDALLRRGIVIADTGDDREREYLIAPSATADWSLDGTPLELYVDFLGTWRRQGFIDLKNGKVTRLMNGQLTIVCYDLHNRQWFLIDKAAIDELCPNGIEMRVNSAMDGKCTGMVPTPSWPEFARGPGTQDRFIRNPSRVSIFDSLAES